MAPISTVAAGTAIAAGKIAFKKAVEDVYGTIKDSSAAKLKQWNTETKIQQLYTKLSKVRKVKTLWQIDKAVDLHSFYCPSHAVIKKQRKQIRNFDDLEFGEHVLIHGIAGQGKSMLMRYIAATELARGKYIPVFVELRRIQDKRSLKSEIFSVLKSLDLDVDEKLFTSLCASSRMLLLLDGFDEIAEAEIQRTISELEDLALGYEHLTIIVSSRPDNGLEASSHFQLVKLDDLKNDEYKTVILKLLEDLGIAEDVIDQVESHEGLIKDCLSTPLMVTMLVVIYKSYAAIPAQFSEFYDSLFKVLLQRHDGVKPGYRRHRRCSMNDTDYRNAFETLCFLTKKIKSSLFSEADLIKCASEALKKCKIDEDPEKFVADIIKITCLIVKEGGKCRFLHKSVQEYYASSLIRRKPEVWVCKFYEGMTILANVRPWQQELAFLSEIDTYRHNRFYLLPLISRLFGKEDGELPDAPPNADDPLVIKLIGKIGLLLDVAGPVPTPLAAYHVDSDPLTKRFVSALWSLDCKSVAAAVRANKIPQSDYVVEQTKPGKVRISISKIVKHGYLQTELITLLNRRLKEIFRSGVTIRNTLKEQEAEDLLAQLLED